MNGKLERSRSIFAMSLSQAPTFCISLVAKEILMSSLKNVKIKCCAIKQRDGFQPHLTMADSEKPGPCKVKNSAKIHCEIAKVCFLFKLFVETKVTTTHLNCCCSEWNPLTLGWFLCVVLYGLTSQYASHFSTRIYKEIKIPNTVMNSVFV